MKKHVVTTCFFHFVYFAINLKKLDENQVKAADVDGDNKATNKDALNILRYSIKIQVKFPIGEYV